MYLDNYDGDHSGKLNEVSSYSTPSSRYISLNITFEDGYNSTGSYPNQLVIQEDRPLGRRLSLMNIEAHISKTLRIVRQDQDTLFWFYADNIFIGLIGTTEEWTEVEENEWFDNEKYKFDFKKQAEFFGRTVDEIQKQYNEKFYHKGLLNSLTATKRGSLGEIKGIPDDILTFGASISPPIKDEEKEYFGEQFTTNESTTIDTVDYTLFELSKEKVKELVNLLDNDIITISQSVLESQSWLHDCKFFSAVKTEEELFVWLKLEDLNEGHFSSYSFAFGRSKDELQQFVRNHEVDFLRHIMYLRSKQTERFESLNEIAREYTRRQGIRSAIATIMSRNMSHNLGSHVLYYTKQDLIENASGYKNAAAHTENDIYVRSLKDSAAIIDFMKDRTNYIAALAEDSKYPSMPVAIWDLLSIFQSDMNGQSVNYYLKNLVRSEGYSANSGAGNLVISLNDQSIQKEELANMFLSLPGGVLSKHGFYNLIENMIRNSAKYWTNKKTENLKFEFKISNLQNGWIGVSFFDKKGDALVKYGGDSLINRMNNKLNKIKFLERDTKAINKEDKGLKEMLLSYLWLTSNTDQESLSKLIFKLDSEDSEDSEAKDAKKMVNERFKFLGFDDNGNGGVNNGKNFGIYFLLPIHHSAISIEDSNETTFESADVRVTNADELNRWENKYPRIAVCQTIPEENSEQMVDLFREAIKKRFENIDDYKICFETKERSYEEANCSNDKCIYFERHLNNSKIDQTIRNYYNNFPYVDSTSGANFTETLRLSFVESFSGAYYTPSIQKKIFALKIKEAALSKITIIDERLFQRITTWADINADNSEFKGSQIELSLKNIRVLNLKKEVRSHSQYQEVVNNMDIFVGNKFRSIVADPDNENKTLFLTIHLGLIEKIVKGGYGYNTATEFMGKLREVFSPDFICIHSGRGGLSKEMDELKEYPFIPFTTLDSLFTDSKFLLSQMFYSLKY